MLALFAERGGDPDRPGKKHPLDALLWRAARPGEPAWDTGDLGLPGRPGWHIECTAIALRPPRRRLRRAGRRQRPGLPAPRDERVRGAGADRQLAVRPRTTCTAGMVGLDGEKMSKSRGQPGVRLGAAPATGVDPMAIRLALLAHHYRGDWEWTAADLAAAEARLARWRDARGPADRAGRRRRAGRRPPAPGRRPGRPGARWPPSTAGPRRPSPAAAPTRPPRTWSPAPSTPSSAYTSESVRAVRPRMAGGSAPGEAPAPREVPIRLATQAGSGTAVSGRGAGRSPRRRSFAARHQSSCVAVPGDGLLQAGPDVAVRGAQPVSARSLAESMA